MKISIFGMGYVGAVSAGCLTASGHEVIGVDPVVGKVDLLNAGKSPVIEKELDGLIRKAVSAGQLRATTDSVDAVCASDLSLICVGTPSRPNGNLDISHVQAAAADIGGALARKSRRHTIVVRSTVLPGTIRNVVVPALEEASGLKAGLDFSVANNPEFLREGVAVSDFYSPPKTVIGSDDQETADTVAAMYAGLQAPLIKTSIEIGEMIKYADNVWHALKVGFANEIGSTCKAIGVDSHAVMDIFCLDTKLNLSPYYLRPGFAFGGSCLPKDVRALTYKARSLDVDTPILNAILRSNEAQIMRAFDMIKCLGKRRIAFLGMSFKAGTDDMRESPVLELIERLIGKGFDIKIFDRNVNLAKLIGANKEYLLKTVPHVSSLLVDNISEALEDSEIVVIGNRDPEFMKINSHLKANQILVDLVRIPREGICDTSYVGVNW
jgi:GDP-mannose 6-dehydrogenase